MSRMSEEKLKYSATELRRFQPSPRRFPTNGVGDLYLAIEFASRRTFIPRRRRRYKVKEKKKKNNETDQVKEPLPTNLIEGPFKSKKMKGRGKNDETQMTETSLPCMEPTNVAAPSPSSSADTRFSEDRFDEAQSDEWEDVPEDELAGLLCRRALNQVLTSNIDHICHGLVHNLVLTKSSTILTIVNTIVTQVLRTEARPFGATGCTLNRAAVSSVEMYAVLMSRFLRVAPQVQYDHSSTLATMAKNSDKTAASQQKGKPVAVSTIVEQMIINALMSLLDEVAKQSVHCSQTRTTFGAGMQHFSEIATSAFTLSLFLVNLHRHGMFRTAALHVILTMLIEENGEPSSRSGSRAGMCASFELWLGSLIIRHIGDVESLIYGSNVGPQDKLKRESQHAARLAVARYFDLLKAAEEMTAWQPARFEIKSVVCRKLRANAAKGSE